MSFEPRDGVVVPFPFTEKKATGHRPALALPDAGEFNIGDSPLAMMTGRDNASWPLGMPITDDAAAGLMAPSVVRMKLLTLGNRLILRKIGTLARRDADTVGRTLEKSLSKSLKSHG